MADALLEHAIATAISVEANRPFVLKDLFTGVEWNSIGKGARLNLGREFKRRVHSGSVPTVQHYSDPANGRANQYIRRV